MQVVAVVVEKRQMQILINQEDKVSKAEATKQMRV
jgi:hypothetical protein